MREAHHRRHAGEVQLEPDGCRRALSRSAFHLEPEDQTAEYRDQEEKPGLRRAGTKKIAELRNRELRNLKTKLVGVRELLKSANSAILQSSLRSLHYALASGEQQLLYSPSNGTRISG